MKKRIQKTVAGRLFQGDGQDEEAERNFELTHLLSLTTKERFAIMRRKSDIIKQTLLRNGHRKPVEIIKRPAR